MNEKTKKTIKNVIRILALVCMVFVFCPSFLVSCAGEEAGISAFVGIVGIESEGYGYIVDPQPIMILCLLLPLSVLIVSFAKKVAEKIIALVCAICSGINLIIWLVFRAKAQELAEKLYCTFECTIWYYLTILCIMAMVALGVVLFVKGKEMVKKVAVPKMAVPKAEQSASIFCPECGTKLLPGSRFCKACGNAMGAKPAAVCSHCGAELNPNMKFCGKCGTPV